MSQADEFAKWVNVLEHAPVDAEGDIPVGDMAWKAMNAIVERIEYDASDFEPSTSLGYGIACAAFWLSLGAVLVALILKGST